VANNAQLYVHLVWATRDREPWITAEIEPRIFARVAVKCREHRCTAIAIGGMPDHIHLLLRLHPTIAVSQLVKEVKGASAYHVTHVLSPETAFAWQHGYGAFSIRRNEVPAVKRYVLHQQEHHGGKNLLFELERI
jgi:putative transposase